MTVDWRPSASLEALHRRAAPAGAVKPVRAEQHGDHHPAGLVRETGSGGWEGPGEGPGRVREDI